MSLYLGNNLISGTQTVTDKSERVGQIIESVIPLTDAGLHLLDGALINGSGSYSAFVDYIADLVTNYPDLFETEANWQTSVTNYGVCGKFVYDSVANTVRLPKITGIVESTTDLTALGDLIEAGLPNITGSLTRFVVGTNYVKTGALDVEAGAFQNGLSSGSSQATSSTLKFDASSSNSIYGNSTTVQPQSIKVLYYIVIATSTKTSIEVDIDQIATDLNGKADVDLTNVTPSQSFKETAVGWGMPDYTAGISKTWNTAHLADKDYLAFVKGFGSSSTNCYYFAVSADASNWTGIEGLYTANGGNGETTAFIPKGMYYKASAGSSNQSLIVYPLKGVN